MSDRDSILSDSPDLISSLIEISKVITRERDLDKLLDLVLEKSRLITGADAGSIYVVEGASEDVLSRALHFKLSQNDSVDFHSSESVMPVSNRSMAGTAVLLQKPINVADVYELDESVSYEFDRSFDQRFGYRCRSMLTVPLISAQDEVIGVVQLINKKRRPERKLEAIEDFEREVIAFDERSQELASTLAAQAGIALENALLYDEIQKIFAGFVRASVQAIEQRDPSTSGHSLRVSVLACSLAREVDRTDSGPYVDTHFSARDLQELEYACLLHDFGKIGVREEVLVKAKKLYPHQREAIRLRVAYAAKEAEADAWRQRLDIAQQGASESDLAEIELRLRQRQAELEELWNIVTKANEPTVLSEGDFSRIFELARTTYVDHEGNQRQLLEEEEVTALCTRRGSLTPSEMDEIRSHVVHTYHFLERIPWGKSMARIPAIAGSHHERLDGSGYPRGTTAPDISLQSRIIAIADVFDALTARDRPYKKALPLDRSLKIIESEAASGYLDQELVRIFVEQRVYSVTETEPEY
jgi:HD-GYP domain-containing protein (c-di-GMP phosphodiesterase class II)